MSAPALAQEASGFDIDDAPPPLPRSLQFDPGGETSQSANAPAESPRLELGARGAVAQGNTAGHALVGFTGGYRVLPSLTLGGYTDVVTSSVSMSDDCAADAQCDFAFQRFGPRAALHLLHDFVVDPWLAASIGAVHVTGAEDPWRADFAVEVGVDVRPLPWLAIGPYVSVARALESRADYDGYSSVGGRVSVQFDLAPSPSHRPAAQTARR